MLKIFQVEWDGVDSGGGVVCRVSVVCVAWHANGKEGMSPEQAVAVRPVDETTPVGSRIANAAADASTVRGGEKGDRGGEDGGRRRFGCGDETDPNKHKAPQKPIDGGNGGKSGKGTASTSSVGQTTPALSLRGGKLAF